MDIDSPHALKRSSSAPMINEINNAGSIVSNQPASVVLIEPATSHPPRPRRFSTSCSPLPLSAGPASPKLSHRVNQLRREESVDVLGREAAHERELNSTMVMSLSCEDLTLVSDSSKVDGSSSSASAEAVGVKNGKGLHLSLGNSGGCSSGVDRPLCSTTSPTRTTPFRQFLSYKNSLTPSPTRRFSRSQSPIAMRPAQFNVSNPVKRKFNLEDKEPPAKKFGSSCLLLNQRSEEPMVVTVEPGLGCQRQTAAEQPD